MSKRFREDPEGTEIDMIGSFIRHGVSAFNAVSEITNVCSWVSTLPNSSEH